MSGLGGAFVLRLGGEDGSCFSARGRGEVAGRGPRATQWRALCRVCTEESWLTPMGWLLLRWGWDREPGQVPRVGGGGDPSWSRYWAAWCGFGLGFTTERDGRGAREGLVLG